MKHIVLAISSITVLAIGFWLAWYEGDCSHAARAGAMVVGIVVLVEGWILLVTKNPGNMPFWRNPASHSAARIAIVLIFIGTIFQGYGDLAARGLQLCH